MLGDAGLAADVSKGTVAVVVKQPTGARIKNSRDAVVARAVFIDSATERFIELAELADEKIEPSVVVVIEPDGAGTPAGLCRGAL